MALWHIPGQGIIDDAQEDVRIPEPGEITLPNGEVLRWGVEGTAKLPEYRNALQYGDTAFQWDPTNKAWTGSMPETAPGYVTGLLDLRDRVRAGTAQPWEYDQYQQYEQQARAIPTRDIGSLTAAWQGEYAGEHANQDWWNRLDPGSPDVGGVMLALRDKLDAGTATAQERALYDQVYGMAGDWNFRASVPQASDAFNPMGDQFFQALTALTMAAGGAGSFGAFGAAGAAGGAGAGAAGAASTPSLLGVPLSTLSTIGQVGTYGGMGANVLGTALDQPWLRTLGLGLGVTGGLAGGLAGLGNVLNTGVQNVGDAARLASSAGRVTGALGRASGLGPLQQASRYLGLAGNVGRLGGGVEGLLGAATGVQQGATQALTETGGRMGEWDWLNLDLGSGEGYGTVLAPGVGDMYAGGSPTFDEAYSNFLGWGGDERQTGWYQNADLDTSGAGGGLLSTLGSLGSSALGFLGRNSSWLGPALSGLGSVGAGAIGSNASRDAAAAQERALNRGLDLQTAQWLQQQANQAPWLQAGQEALTHMTGRAQWAGPERPGATGAVSGANYALPAATPGWTPQGYQGPQAVNAGDYRYTPGQGPRAQDYRYTPGAIPAASQYRYTPGAVPTLSGAELLANDPGVAFRLQEGRNALEASAAARGGALSGPALAALQRQGQELSSQEYGNAWQRAAQQAQMREGWAQQASQMGFGQAMSEAQLREQLQQVATQQGWSQAQTEAVFREQLAQQASQQGFSQALQGQQAAWGQGLQAQQWAQGQRQQYDTDAYNRMLQQSQIGYGRDVYQNQTDYERQQQAYQQQIAELTRQWNQFASLSGSGQVSAGQLGQGGQQNASQMASLLSQLGNAQAGGTLGSGQSWMSALGNVGQSVQGGLQNQALLTALQGLNR